MRRDLRRFLRLRPPQAAAHRSPAATWRACMAPRRDPPALPVPSPPLGPFSGSPASSRISTAAGSSPARARCHLRILQGSADRDLRPPRLPLHQPELGQSRLWIPAPSARLAIRRFGGIKLSSQPMHFAHLITGAADRDVRGRLRQPCVRPLGFLERIGPRAVELQDARPVNLAVASRGYALRLGGTPGIECRGPLARAAEVVDLVTPLDDAAVDATHESGDTAPDVTAAIASSSMAMPAPVSPSRISTRPTAVTCQGDEVLVAESRPDGSRSPRTLAERRRHVACDRSAKRLGLEEVASAPPLLAPFLQQPGAASDASLRQAPFSLQQCGNPSQNAERAAAGIFPWVRKSWWARAQMTAAAAGFR